MLIVESRLNAYYNDRGNYTCIVKNLAGEDYSTVSIDVSGKDK